VGSKLIASILELCSIYNLRYAICHKSVIRNRMNMRRNCRKRGSGPPTNSRPRVPEFAKVLSKRAYTLCCQVYRL